MNKPDAKKTAKKAAPKSAPKAAAAKKPKAAAAKQAKVVKEKAKVLKAPKKTARAAPEPTSAVFNRSGRKTREGVVVSNKMSKTVVVSIDRRMQHGLYGKTVTRSRRFKAHDAVGCDEGDKILIMETRPMSREKRWRVVKILEKVK